MTVPGPSWSHADTVKLRAMLLDGCHTWAMIVVKFPNRTSKAVQARAHHIRCKNVYYVDHEKRIAERKAAKVSKSPAPKKSRPPYLTCDRMVSPAKAELAHANGQRVNYA